MTVLLICFITTTWKPPLDWTITEIANQSSSVQVTLSRTVQNGETITVPTGCQTATPVGSGITVMPNYSHPLNLHTPGMGLGVPRAD